MHSACQGPAAQLWFVIGGFCGILLRLIRQVKGQPPKSISLTWRYLIYPGVSRGMRKNIVVLSSVSQLRLSVDPPQLALRASCQAAAVPLRQPRRLCLSPGSDLPQQKQQQLSAVSVLSAPPCWNAELISSHRWYLSLWQCCIRRCLGQCLFVSSCECASVSLED